MTAATELAVELIALVRDNEDKANFADGCSPEMLEAAEQRLGVAFPPSYRRVIEEFGTWEIAGVEFLGVYQTPAMGEELLGSVHATVEGWSRGLPESLVVVMFDDMVGLVSVDMGRTNPEGEAPVVAWTPDGRAEELGSDFGSYALHVCQNAVQGWQR